ncbi:hypothetical protein ATK36_4862 [Amycolatopsis sulphurea]|uniref:Uncharacterized protein n=1 Tax=Amycolatopsis sulphurea TaxID=76022 RepID=A0A2A9FGQ6_9PSEU|nr:hypothetical protein ATK36_4862 [Amycolatopsis sulphurea]
MVQHGVELVLVGASTCPAVQRLGTGVAAIEGGGSVGQAETPGGLLDGAAGRELTQVQRGAAAQVDLSDAGEVPEVLVIPVLLQELGDVLGTELGAADGRVQAARSVSAGVALEHRGDRLAHPLRAVRASGQESPAPGSFARTAVVVGQQAPQFAAQGLGRAEME